LTNAICLGYDFPDGFLPNFHFICEDCGAEVTRKNHYCHNCGCEIHVPKVNVSDTVRYKAPEKSFVCVDIDGVIVNLMQGLHLLLKEQGLDFDPAMVSKFNFDYPELGFPREIIYNSFENKRLYELAPLHSGVEDAISKLRDFINIRAYTGSLGDEEICQKRQHLCNSFGMFGSVYYRKNKPTIFNADALFDDCLGVHKQWIEDGSNALLFLIDQPYNQEYNNEGIDWSRIIRCKDFADAVDKYIEIRG
jgi:hypothetical protein